MQNINIKRVALTRRNNLKGTECRQWNRLSWIESKIVPIRDLSGMSTRIDTSRGVYLSKVADRDVCGHKRLVDAANRIQCLGWKWRDDPRIRSFALIYQGP